MPEVIMPRLSDTMEAGVITSWLKQEGDTVKAGDVIGEIETDKATMDLEVYDDGVLEQLLIEPGSRVAIGQVVAIIGDGSGIAAAATRGAPNHEVQGEAGQDQARPADLRSADVRAAGSSRPQPGPERAEPPRGGDPGRILTSPLARRIAAEHGIDPAMVKGTGPGGRIVRADVESAIAASAAPGSIDGTAGAGWAPRTTAGGPGRDSVEIPLTRMRKVLAAKLGESAAAPHFFLTNAVNVDRLFAFRAELNERFAEAGVKVSVTDILVRACAVTLRRHPKVNASWAGEKILEHRRIHVGLAVALPDGLMVPVVKDADTKALDEIAAETHMLAGKARAGTLTLPEISDGTISISNLGMYGIDNFFAVINPPEAAILAIGNATMEPYEKEGELRSRRVLKITMTADHRVLDGAVAAAFLHDFKRTLEEPLRIVT